jgi:hypothetical protein
VDQETVRWLGASPVRESAGAATTTSLAGGIPPQPHTRRIAVGELDARGLKGSA